MPQSRDPSATKARILAAAADEFAEHGVAGARYERVAAKASANKERIYAYFGDKTELFAAVLEDRMPALAAAHAPAPADPSRIGEHVGALFDFHAENPGLTRLAMWEALRYGADEVPASARRAQHYGGHRQTVASALGEGSTSDPGHLSFALSSLVTWWFAAPHLARFHIDDDPLGPAAHARQRAMVVDVSTRLLPTSDGGRLRR